MSKYLIVPGLPKTGTTFIYSQLSALSENFNLPAERKEVDYFRRGQCVEEYNSLFSTQDVNKVYLDASPLYADNITRTFERIDECLKGCEVKIIFCIRNPFERIYSHYLHDIAQNFHIMGQAAHSIYMPSVISRYLYPTAPRVQYLIDRYGKEHVHGFSFADTCEGVTKLLHSFASIESSWGFDFSKNPAPGFTSPRAYYSKSKELTITIAGSTYTLPRGALLVANRQFSAIYKNIASDIASNVLEGQSFLDRTFNAEKIGNKVCERIWRDYVESAELLDLNISEKITNFESHVSEEMPDSILSQLECTGVLSDTVNDIYEHPLRAAGLATISTSAEPVTLSSYMALLERAASGQDPEGKRPLHYLELIIDKFGPSPYYTELLIKNLLKQGRSQTVIEFLERYSCGSTLFRPINVNKYIDDYKTCINESDYQRIINLEKSGV